jgi:hypothetical protein
MVDRWIGDLAARRGWQIIRALDAGGAEFTGSTGSGLQWTCHADPVQGDRTRPVPAAEFRCRDVSADDIRWLVITRDQSPGFTVASSQDVGGDLAVAAISAMAWVLRRGRPVRRAEPSRTDAAGTGTPQASGSVMGVGWSVDDPVGMVDPQTAVMLRGTTVVPGGATIAVHLNQNGMYVRSGQWWNDAARLEHLIDCGILLSDRARALGARPSKHR